MTAKHHPHGAFTSWLLTFNLMNVYTRCWCMLILMLPTPTLDEQQLHLCFIDET